MIVLFGVIFLLKRFIFSGSSKQSLSVKLSEYFDDEKTTLFVTPDSQIQEDKTPSTPQGDDSFDAFAHKEIVAKNQKIFYFANDYCRASPYLNIKDKMVYNPGWRKEKSSFMVEYDTFDYEIAENKTVSYLSLFLQDHVHVKLYKREKRKVFSSRERLLH